MGEEWQTEANEPRPSNIYHDNINGETPGANQVNYVDVSSNQSSSGEEMPQDYKPAEYLLLNKK